MSPNSIPKDVERIIQKLEPMTYGMSLAGAGGGGFLYVIMKETNCEKMVKKIIDDEGLSMIIYKAELSNKGIVVDYK